MTDIDGLHVTVTKGDRSNYVGKFFSGKIEEDTWHSAELTKIISGESKFKDKTSPAWIWIYTLLDASFSYTDSESGEEGQYIITEKSSQKFTTAPRESKAYVRYCQLKGAEPTVGEEINLTDLFGTKCKLMIVNKPGNKIIFHNIEKVSIKDIELKKKTKKVKTKVKEKVDIKATAPISNEDDEDDEDIFADLM